MARAGLLSRVLARTIRATAVIDRIHSRLTRLRSRAVLKWASDGFYDAYNDVAYPRERLHLEGTDSSQMLQPWERRILEEFFPPPPARVLVGGAGRGREALALERFGYRVTAFDPAASLVADAQQRVGKAGTVEFLCGRYEDLPHLLVPQGSPVDLSQHDAFDAALFGWGSFSHLRSDTQCLTALRRVRDLTAGPIVVSYLPGPSDGDPTEWFSIQIGYCRQYSAAHIRTFAAEAGLVVVESDDTGNWPYAVLRPPDGR